VTDGNAAGLSVLKHALEAFRTEQMAREDELAGFPFACVVAFSLWEEESSYALFARYVRLARTTGALTACPSRSSST
jgi:hypothetical protein